MSLSRPFAAVAALLITVATFHQALTVPVAPNAMEAFWPAALA